MTANLARALEAIDPVGMHYYDAAPIARVSIELPEKWKGRLRIRTTVMGVRLEAQSPGGLIQLDLTAQEASTLAEALEDAAAAWMVADAAGDSAEWSA